MKTSRVKKSIMATAIALLCASPGVVQAMDKKDREAFIQLYKDAGLSDADSKKAAEKSWTFVNSEKFRELLNEMDDISKKQAKTLQRLEAMAGAARHIQKLAEEKGIDGKPTLEELGKQYPLALYSGKDIPWKFPEDIVKNLEEINKKIKQGEKSYRDLNPEQKVSFAIRRAYEDEYYRKIATASASAAQAQRDAEAAARASAWYAERLAYYKETNQKWQDQYERNKAAYAASLDWWQSRQDEQAYRRIITYKLLNEPLNKRYSSGEYDAIINQFWHNEHQSLTEKTASSSYEWTAPNSPKAYESKTYYHPITSSSVLSQINSSASAALVVGSAQPYTPGLMQIAQGGLPGNVKSAPFVSVNIGPAGCTFTKTSGSCGALGISVGFNNNGQITAAYTKTSPAVGLTPGIAVGARVTFPGWSGIPGITFGGHQRFGIQYGVTGAKVFTGVQFIYER